MPLNFHSFSTPILILASFGILACSHAEAQCANPNITSAFQTALRRAPRGSGNSGECNPVNYGGGSWASQTDL